MATSSLDSRLKDLEVILNEIFKKDDNYEYDFLVIDLKKSIISFYNQNQGEDTSNYIDTADGLFITRNSKNDIEVHRLDLEPFIELFIQKILKSWSDAENIDFFNKRKEKIISSCLKEIFPFCVFHVEEKDKMIKSHKIMVLKEDVLSFFIGLWCHWQKNCQTYDSYED